MANALTTIRNARAIGELARCKNVDGFQFSLLHNGSTTTGLWGRAPDAAVESSREQGVVDEREYTRIRIPRQTGFTGGLAGNDEITVTTSGLDITNNVYLVDSWEKEHDGAVYAALVYRRVTRRSDV